MWRRGTKMRGIRSRKVKIWTYKKPNHRLAGAVMVHKEILMHPI